MTTKSLSLGYMEKIKRGRGRPLNIKQDYIVYGLRTEKNYSFREIAKEVGEDVKDVFVRYTRVKAKIEALEKAPK